MKRTCKQCGKEFELSESEVSFYKSKGLELPKRCKSCREKNKGYSNSTGQQQKSVKTRSGTGGVSWNGNNNDNKQNRNDKSYVVVAAVAVLLLLIVFGMKSILTVPSERIAANEDVVSSTIQLKQETPDEALKETPVETLRAVESEPQQAERKDEEPLKEPLPQQPDVQTQQEPQKEPLTEITPVEIATTIEVVPETPNVAYSFRKPEYLTEHFQKHGAEFPYATEEEYLLGANNVIQNPNAFHKLEAEDGDDVYYVESTREFVIVSTDGYIRTYFTADLDYYNRQ